MLNKGFMAVGRGDNLTFKMLFERNPIPMWVYDEQTLCFLEVNQAAIQQYGYSREEFLRMTIADIRPPDDVARLRKFLEGKIRTGRFGGWRHQRADGSMIDVDITILGIRFRGRAALLAAPIDVTEQKRAQQALVESERRFRAMTSNVPGLVYQRLMKPTGKFHYPYMSGSALHILGLDAEEIMRGNNDPLRRAIHPDDIEGTLASIRSSAENLTTWSHNLRLRGVDGQMRWFIGRGVPCRLENGDTLWDSLLIDVSEQKKFEEALLESRARLHRSEQHLARAQRVAGIGSFEIDLKTNRLTWSDEIYRIHKVSPETFVPTLETIWEMIVEEDRAFILGGIEQAKRGVSPHPAEFRTRHPDGQIRTIYRDSELIFDEAGNAIGLIGAIRDVTELRAAERHREELQLQLHHSQKMEALGTLAGGIAHDLNNALVPVLALSKLLMTEMPEGSREWAELDLISQGAERARNLVKQILTFSRKEVPSRQVLDVSAHVRETLRLLRASLPATIMIKEAIDCVPPISGNPDQLHQVIVNLVTNSAQAIGNSIGTITVEVALCAAENKRFPGRENADRIINLSIADTGCGMAQETIDRIFEPFFTTKPVGEGTGLGMSVVHGIITAHDGLIEIESRLGEGTRVDIYLPLHR